MKKLLIYMAFVSVLLSCKERAWDNPFDPDCPKEIFTPGDIIASQKGASIIVNWTQFNSNISGFRLYRNSNNGNWGIVATPDENTLTWTDNYFDGGIKYGYKIMAVAGENISNEKQTTITPILGAKISTVAASEITSSSAISGGVISSDGGSPVTERGICYGTSQNPDINGKKTSSGNGTGSFISSVLNLIPNTIYYVRAYATNSYGTAYGNQVSFTTSTSMAILTTDIVTVFTNNAGVLGGNVSSDGGLMVTERGICYGTAQNPTTSNNKTPIGTGTGSFNKTITNLSNNTTYYIRSYAINSKGTSYGNQVSFKTDNPLVDVDGNVYKTIIIGNQVWMAENLKTTKFGNGNSISYITDYPSWESLTTGAYCYFFNNTSIGAIYGALYNFFAVKDTRNLCPTGWHVPSDTEWTILSNYLGGEDVAGGKLKESGTTHWDSPNSGADDSSGFTALAGSWRGPTGSFFYNTGRSAALWSSTPYNTESSWFYELAYNSSTLNRRANNVYFLNNAGLSVRCVKN